MKVIAAIAFLAAAAQLANAKISDSTLKEMLTAVNVFRAANGRTPLILDQRLVDVAQSHSDDMGSTCTMTHDSSDGTSFSTRVVAALDGQFSMVAENIAQGYGSVSDVMTGWKNSPSHRTNLLRDTINYVGFGLNTNCGGMWTQDFANFPASTLELVDSIGTFTGIGSTTSTTKKSTTTTKSPSPSPKTSSRTTTRSTTRTSPSPSPRTSPRTSPSPSPRPRTTTTTTTTTVRTTTTRPTTTRTTTSRTILSIFTRVIASPSPSPSPSPSAGTFTNFTGSVNFTNGTNGSWINGTWVNGTWVNGTNGTNATNSTSGPTHTLTVVLEQPTAASTAPSADELVNALEDAAVDSELLPDQQIADGATDVSDIVLSAALLPDPLKL